MLSSHTFSFDAFDHGGLWLLYGDQYEDPVGFLNDKNRRKCLSQIATTKKSAIHGYLYLAEYGISIVELSQPVIDRNISCFPSAEHLERMYIRNPEFKSTLI